MKLSSILSMFMLLTVGSTNLFGGPWDFLKKRGSLGHYLVFQETGECRKCKLQYYNLSPIIEQHEGKEIDLRGSNCTGTNMSNVNLSKAKLTGTTLDYANLENSILKKAEAGWAKFKRTNMRNTNMYRANLFGTNFEGTNFQNADLTRVFASCTTMKDTNLRNSKLDSAILDLAKLYNTNLYGAKVSKMDFHNVECDSVDFRNIENLDKTGLFDKTGLRAPRFLKNCKFDFPSEEQAPTAAQTITASMLAWLSL